MRHLLVLSDMRASRIEESDRPVAWAHTATALEAFLAAEKVEPYQEPDGDRTWSKTFRKGGPLEWCNDTRGAWGQPKIIEVNGPEEAGIEATRGATQFFAELPMVGPGVIDAPALYPAALASPREDVLEATLRAYAAMWKLAARLVVDGEEAAWVHTGQPAEVWDALRARGIDPTREEDPAG